MSFLKLKVWPVVAGFIVASIAMMVFEYVNSFFFPLPADLNWNDPASVQAFTATLPWTAYILVLLGWVLGSFKAGYVTTYLSREQTYRLSLVAGVILTILGVINNMAIGHDIFFNIIGLPVFIVFTYVGHRYFLRARAKKVAGTASALL